MQRFAENSLSRLAQTHTLEALDRDDAEALWPWLGLLIVVSVALAAFRLFALQVNATDLFFDEAQYFVWSQEPAFGYYSKPPLIAWLIGAATAVCGTGEACVRSPSPLLYVLGTFGVFAAAIQLYGPRIAFFSGLAFATLPGVSLSAGIISTDVPLLVAWAWALAAFIALVRGAGWWNALALGLALGIGLNGKYAMAYFVLCAAIYAIANPKMRWIWANAKLWVAIAIAIAMITPNVLWNLDNGFATLAHTADNANWSGQLGNPAKALEFFGAQFGVFGPILFAGLLIICVRAWRDGLNQADALLLCFAIPVIVIVTTQAFISRAHANWAAVSYVAATILVTATMIRDLSWRWLTTSLAIHIALVFGLAASLSYAGKFALPGNVDPFARTLGWRDLSTAVRKVADKADMPNGAAIPLIADNRALAAELLYHQPATGYDVLAWRGAGRPKDHFALTRPYRAKVPDPVLLVTMRKLMREAIVSRFTIVTLVERLEVPAGQGRPRKVEVWKLSGFKGL